MFKDKGWGEADRLDRRHLPVDPELPQLASMLDGKSMGRLFQSELEGGFSSGRLQIERCRIAYASYRPTRNALVAYELRIRDQDTDRQGRQFLIGKVYAGERAKHYLAKRTKYIKPVPDYGLSWSYLPGWKLLLTAYPNDIAMRGLEKLTRTGRLQSILRRISPGQQLRLTRLTDAPGRVQVVSYKPERSCLVRCAVTPDPSQKGEAPRSVYARMYHNQRGEQIHNTMQLLWRTGARRSGHFSVAEPLGYDPRSRLLLQGSVGRTPLSPAADPEELPDRVGVMARSLAALHSTRIQLERSRAPQTELELLETWSPGIVRVLPGTGRRFERAVHALGRTLPTPPAAGWSPIHGDFSLNQVVLDGDRQSFIDFDATGCGDPLQDLASFLVRLERPREQGGINASLRKRITGEFCRHYEAAAGNELNERQLAWHQTAGFLRMAVNALKHLLPGWHQLVDRYIDRAEDMLGEAGGSHA